MNLHSLPLLNRVSLYSFPLSYNLPEGFSFRSLRYMIFYFLKELVASLSQIRFLYLLTSYVVIKLSFSVRQNRSDFSFFSGLTFVFPSLVLLPNSLWLSLLSLSAFPLFLSFVSGVQR